MRSASGRGNLIRQRHRDARNAIANSASTFSRETSTTVQFDKGNAGAQRDTQVRRSSRTTIRPKKDCGALPNPECARTKLCLEEMRTRKSPRMHRPEPRKHIRRRLIYEGLFVAEQSRGIAPHRRHLGVPLSESDLRRR